MKVHRGLTLIKVVASLVLVATTVSVLLLAQSRSLQQLSATRHQETAAALANDLILGWKVAPVTQGQTVEGTFESRPGWRWRRQTQAHPDSRQMNLIDVTLTIYRLDGTGPERVMARYTWIEIDNDR